MKFDTSFWMMFAFIIFMILGVWKIYAFLPTKQLVDDDKTQESEQELLQLMLQVIKEKKGNLQSHELFIAIQENADFNGKLFWRFNQNRLNQLLQKYYIQNPHCSSIKEIYKNNNCKIINEGQPLCD